MNVRFTKIIEDIFNNFTKTLLVALTIFISVFSFSTILNSYIITDREMEKSYKSINPSNFIITINNFDKKITQELKTIDNIQYVEPRKQEIVQTFSDGNLYETEIYVIDNVNDLKINTFEMINNTSINNNEVLIETTSNSIINKKIGDIITIRKDGLNYDLILKSEVKADGTDPAWMHNRIYAYISYDTAQNLNIDNDNYDILFTVKDCNSINETVQTVKDRINNLGYEITSISVNEKNEHSNASQMNSIIFLFEFFGILSVLLSSILIANVISSILKSQIKQISIMKSFGASGIQITRMYIMFITIISSASTISAIILSQTASKLFSDMISRLLVFSIYEYNLPLWAYIIEIFVGIIIPILVSIIPTIRTLKTTVDKGLKDYGTNDNKINNYKFFSIIKNSKLEMGLKNAFRKPKRLISSIITITIGGAILMTSINLRSSLEKTYKDILNTYNFDVQIILRDYYSSEYIQKNINMEDIENVYNIKSKYKEKTKPENIELIYDNSKDISVLNIKYKNDIEENYSKTIKQLEGSTNILKINTIENAEEIYNKHLLTISSFLTTASLLVIVVGIISMISICGISIVERKREIGIMRSMGGKSKDIFKIIVYENLLISFISLLTAIIISMPLTHISTDLFGKLFLNQSLSKSVSLKGIIIWTIITIIIPIIVSILNNIKINKISVKNMLNYE